MVRRQEGSQHSHTHEPQNIEAMFKRLDADGDGFITNSEIRELVDKRQYHSEALTKLVSEATKTSGTSLAEFTVAVHKANELGALHHTRHDASVHQHSKGHAKNVPSTWITSCGGHKAETCEKCPTTNSEGNTVASQGGDWDHSMCNGDCEYNPGDGKCHKKGTMTITGTVAGTATQWSTSPVPDLLNPNMTQKDDEVVDEAAGAAIKEENIEAAEKQRQEEEDSENKKFSWSKFWLIVIITFSVILGICAIVSVVALVVFCFMGNQGPAGKDDEEGEAFADDAGEEADGDDAGEATAEAVEAS
jgi:hypothetical protein